jgi:uncharacterized protein YjaZ
MLVYSDPNDYNLSRLKGAAVHELLHTLHFAVTPFNPMTVTVGEYIVAEGLAESFAAELCGDAVVGYYVTDFNDAQLEQARHVIGAALDVTGFDAVRGYIFGDAIAATMGLPLVGVPAYAGYAMGYRAVRQYLNRTGKTVPEAIFVPARQILAESGFFA